MTINIKNAVSQQRHLPIHPEWWKKQKSDEELEAALVTKVEGWQKIIKKYEEYEENTLQEKLLMDDCRRWIGIVTEEA